jgi:hypothetical protein
MNKNSLKGEQMKKFMLAMLFCLPMYTSTYCQVADTMYIPNIYIMPGATATLPITLTNNTFPVGGLTVNLQIGDSSQASFVSVARGADFINFEYYYTHLTAGSLRLAAVADMPGAIRIPPLAIGSHQVALVGIAVSPNSPAGMSTEVLFANSLPRDNAITDSTGYAVVFPRLIDGNVIFGSTDIPEQVPPVATQFTLASNYPNPFNSQTKISFQIREAGHANLAIYDITGRRIANLTDEILAPGEYDFTWTGHSDTGGEMPTGVYFYRLSMNGISETKKMCYLK